MKSIKWVAISLVALVIALALLIWSINFHPPALQPEVVINQTEAPILKPSQQVKILCNSKCPT